MGADGNVSASYLRSKRVLNIIATVALAASVAIAFGRALTSVPKEAPPETTETQRRVAYTLMATDERNMRRDAIKDFPADPWSQDDAFHNSEYRRARQIAEQRKLALQDVLRAADEGMREHWPKPAGIHQRPTVPPCRPRPIH